MSQAKHFIRNHLFEFDRKFPYTMVTRFGTKIYEKQAVADMADIILYIVHSADYFFL